MFKNINYKKNLKFSNLSRDKNKNALSIISDQSKKIDSLDDVKSKFDETLMNEEILSQRPKYWGGFSFIPFYFEFWEGQKFRLNKRQVFKEKNGNWSKFNLQP